MSTNSAERHGLAARPVVRRVLGFLASDRGLLLVSVLLSLSWLAGLLWL